MMTAVPGLSDVDPEAFAVSVCWVDGSVLNLGDTDKRFLSQSTFKPLVHAFALSHIGSERINRCVAATGSKVFSRTRADLSYLLRWV